MYLYGVDDRIKRISSVLSSHLAQTSLARTVTVPSLGSRAARVLS